MRPPLAQPLSELLNGSRSRVTNLRVRVCNCPKFLLAISNLQIPDCFVLNRPPAYAHDHAQGAPPSLITTHPFGAGARRSSRANSPRAGDGKGVSARGCVQQRLAEGPPPAHCPRCSESSPAPRPIHSELGRPALDAGNGVGGSMADQKNFFRQIAVNYRLLAEIAANPKLNQRMLDMALSSQG